MDSDRKTALRTGVLFIIATIAAIAAAAVLPSLSGTGYLTGVANHSNQMAASALLYLIAAGTSVGIAISLYPLLKPVNAALALGSVVFRTIEAVFYTAAVVGLLSLLTLGQQIATAPADNRVPIQAMADSIERYCRWACLSATINTGGSSVTMREMRRSWSSGEQSSR